MKQTTRMIQPNPKLHHLCQNITKGSLQDVVEMYKMLHFDVVYTPVDATDWLMIGQMNLRFGIQLAEVSAEPIEDLEIKRQTHLAFLSDDPKKVISTVQEWAKVKGIRFREGGWSEKECYFDLPDLFVNFVIEVMHSSIDE